MASREHLCHGCSVASSMHRVEVGLMTAYFCLMPIDRERLLGDTSLMMCHPIDVLSAQYLLGGHAYLLIYSCLPYGIRRSIGSPSSIAVSQCYC
jgi:hypothetical protein